MSKHNAYLVCGEHISEVKDFLIRFFRWKEDEYDPDGSVTIVVPESNFLINLMKGHNQPLTQNITFEMGVESMEMLEKFAKENNTETKILMVSNVEHPYLHYYVEVLGPYNICKIKAFYNGGM